MIFEGCQGKASENYMIHKICPECGEEVELFSTDTEVVCDNCGKIVYNDTLSCVMWCDQAKECVGEELYNKIMAANDLAVDQKGELKIEEDDGPLNFFSF